MRLAETKLQIKVQSYNLITSVKLYIVNGSFLFILYCNYTKKKKNNNTSVNHAFFHMKKEKKEMFP